jgi:hypothetical protein
MPIDERVGKRGEVTTLGLGLACAGTRNGWIFCDFLEGRPAIGLSPAGRHNAVENPEQLRNNWGKGLFCNEKEKLIKK